MTKQGPENDILFKITQHTPRELVRQEPDGKIVFANDITLNDALDVIRQLVQKVPPNSSHQEPELDVDAYIKFVEKTARERQVVQGEEFRESDFFMGASCIFYHLKQQDGTKLSLPPRWYVPIIAGRSVLDEIKMSEGE